MANMNLRKIRKITIVFAILLFMFIVIVFFLTLMNRTTIIEHYSIPYSSTIASAKDSADLLSYDDYVFLNEKIDFFYSPDRRGYSEYEEDGVIKTRPSNGELFRTLYTNGFEPIESMFIDDSEIGFSFVRDRVYPKDYDYRTYKIHAEYGVCFIYDDYIDNLPEIKKNFLSSVEIVYLEKIYDNMYIYVAKRNF